MYGMGLQDSRMRNKKGLCDTHHIGLKRIVLLEGIANTKSNRESQLIAKATNKQV